jgi:hypothetical protein
VSACFKAGFAANGVGQREALLAWEHTTALPSPAAAGSGQPTSCCPCRRMSGAGDWPLLQEAAAHLYTQQGRYEDALRLLLQLRSPAVFDYIARHALVDRVSPFAAGGAQAALGWAAGWVGGLLVVDRQLCGPCPVSAPAAGTKSLPRCALPCRQRQQCPTQAPTWEQPSVPPACAGPPYDCVLPHAPPAAALLDLDEVRATSLLVEHCEEVPPGDVVAALQDAAAAAPDAAARQRWRRRLHAYLDWLFQRDSQLGGAFAELQVGGAGQQGGACARTGLPTPPHTRPLPFALPLPHSCAVPPQVELYAEFEPSRLLHFLMVSPSYPLERAYQVGRPPLLLWGSSSLQTDPHMGFAGEVLLLLLWLRTLPSPSQHTHWHTQQPPQHTSTGTHTQPPHPTPPPWRRCVRSAGWCARWCLCWGAWAPRRRRCA